MSALLFIPPAVGFIVAFLNRLSLRVFTGVYALLTACLMVFLYLNGSLADMLLPLGIAIGGLLLSIVLVGLLGGKLSQMGTRSTMVAFGLFPWALNPIASLVYLGVLVVGGVVLALLKLRKGATASIIRSKKPKDKGEKKIVLVSPVFGLAALLVALLIIL